MAQPPYGASNRNPYYNQPGGPGQYYDDNRDVQDAAMRSTTALINSQETGPPQQQQQFPMYREHDALGSADSCNGDDDENIDLPSLSSRFV